ncbi:MAG TPA: RsmE family RNA methyltransferase [Candidatus Paceibacterota bacterium]|nr:RsmE family RNA methyltransferase [Candidatus Paceibacterota bacterium]
MRLHRFFTREQLVEGATITLHDSSLAHQLRSVFRLKAGDKVVLFDGSGFEYVSLVGKLQTDCVDVTISEKQSTCFIPHKKVHLGMAILKKDNFEWVLEKCTEVGVTCFTPLVSERTEKKNIDTIRAQKIIIEASEQSGRCAVPVINEVTPLEDFLKTNTLPIFAFHGKGDFFDREKITHYTEVCVLVGPEGGWSEKEVSLMKTHGVHVVSLGSQTLRAETASVAISSLLLF